MMPRGVVFPCRERSDVDLSTLRPRHDFREVVGPYSASRHHLDAIAGVLDQAADQLEPLTDCRLLTAGEHTRDTEVDELVERAKRIGCDVERAMEHRVARARNLPERSCA